jgi:hypothetical protein
MRTEGQTYMTKLTVASCSFASAPKNCGHDNVGDILSPRSMFVKKPGDLRTCAFRFRSKTKEIKTPFLNFELFLEK